MYCTRGISQMANEKLSSVLTIARNPIDQSSVSLDNRLTTGAENYTGKVFERFEPQTHAASYYGSRILIGLFAQTMHISNTAICSEINCPNTRLRVKIRGLAYGNWKLADFFELVLVLSRFCGLPSIKRTSYYGTMLMKLTWPRNWRIQIREKPLLCDLQSAKHGGYWVRTVAKCGSKPCQMQRRKHVKCRFL